MTFHLTLLTLTSDAAMRFGITCAAEAA